MRIDSLHHAQIPYPRGAEAEARRFYGEGLGLAEMPRPRELDDRPGMWFDLGHGQQLHLLALDEDVGSPSYHFALRVPDLAGTRAELRARGVASEDRERFAELGYDRCFVRDPFGNTIELLQVSSGT